MAPYPIGLAGILRALALSGKPVGKMGTQPFPTMAGIPTQQNYLASGGADLNPILVGLLGQQGLPPNQES